MPELPEVETVRRSLAPRLCGAAILGVRAEAVRLRRGVVPEHWRGLVGKRFEAVERRGKYLLLRCSGATTAVVHLGMSGRLLLLGRGVPPPPHTHIDLALEGARLVFADPRRFGTAVVLEAGEADTFGPLLGLGVEPSSPEAPAVLARAARASRTPIRNLLLDQSVLAGLGNIYACEALARAGIRPSRPASRIAPARLARLAEAVGEVLDDALADGGTTLADGGFVDAAGASGFFAVRLRVYGREGEPCLQCGRAVRRGVSAGRSFFFCPRCQR